MLPQGHCQICLGYHAISEFQVLPCGHGSCKTCHERLFDPISNMGNCFMCRKEFSRESAHRLHLDLVDSKVAILATTIEGLEKMDAATKAISVTRAVGRIQRTAQEIECDNEGAASLQQAINEFQSRIVPVFTQLEAQTKELVELRLKLSRAEEKVKAFDVVCEESRKKDGRLVVLASKLNETEKANEKALSLAEQLSIDLVADRNEKERLQTENRHLRAVLEKQAGEARWQKSRNHKLKLEVAQLKEQNQSLEDSQLIVVNESISVTPSDDPVDENFTSSSSDHTSSFERIRNTPHRSSGLSQITNKLFLDVDLDCDGMMKPGFSSDWSMKATMTQEPKRKATNFPIPLDKRGRPTHPVQTGPIRSRRLPSVRS